MHRLLFTSRSCRRHSRHATARATKLRYTLSSATRWGSLSSGSRMIAASVSRTPCPARRRASRLLEHARAAQQRTQRHPQRLRDRAQDAERRLVEPALELAQVGVGDLGALGQLPQREARGLPLGPQQRAERLQPGLPGVLAHARHLRRPAGTASAPAGRPQPRRHRAGRVRQPVEPAPQVARGPSGARGNGPAPRGSPSSSGAPTPRAAPPPRRPRAARAGARGRPACGRRPCRARCPCSA